MKEQLKVMFNDYKSVNPSVPPLKLFYLRREGKSTLLLLLHHLGEGVVNKGPWHIFLSPLILRIPLAAIIKGSKMDPILPFLSSRAVLSNMIATTHLWSFKLLKIKVNKNALVLSSITN